LAVGLPAPAIAQEACEAQVTNLNSINGRYSEEQRAIQSEAESIEGQSGNATISGVVDIQMREQRWIFDLPTATMRNRAMSLDLPQVAMRSRTISWDNPTIVMRRVKTGEYPQMTCRGFPPRCTVRWRPIYTNVPTTEMRRQEIRFEVPEFRMARTEWSLAVPEFRMARQEWVVKIPEITLRDIRAEGRDLERRGRAVSDQASALAARMQTETAGAASVVYQCYRDDLNTKRAEIITQFDAGVGQLEAAIAAMRAQNIDPAAVQMDGETVNLIAQRDQLLRDKEAAVAQIDAAATQLEQQQHQLTNEIIT